MTKADLMAHICFVWAPSSLKLDGSEKSGREASPRPLRDVPLVQFLEMNPTKLISRPEALDDACF